jgi:cyclopropane fatty-acyl-phospholipid synthase-like methyltransferase
MQDGQIDLVVMENHNKYSRDVIPETEESLSKIVAQIHANSVVLDIGCSSGMLGRYLVLQKECVVDGVDIDQGAIEVCRPVYRKVVIRNLETDSITAISFMSLMTTSLLPMSSSI